MKKLLFLFLSAIIMAGCSDDDTTVQQPQKFIETGAFELTYKGEKLEFKDIRAVPGGPDSPHDLEMASVISYDDVTATKYSLVMTFNKDEAGNYVLYSITLGVDDRQGPNSFYLKGYYAYTSGEFEVPGFNHNTSSETTDDIIHISGNFSGTLLPGNNQPEPIEIENGKFWANFKPFQ